MSKTASQNESKSDKTIAKKTAELDQLVSWFSSEDFNLDEALEKYKKATELATEIGDDLKNLKNEITILSEDFTKS